MVSQKKAQTLIFLFFAFFSQNVKALSKDLPIGSVTQVRIPVQKLPDISPVNLTDINWIKGIGRKAAYLCLIDTPENRTQYAVGKGIRFANGELRQITAHDKSSVYLFVYFSGSPMDGNIVGYPKKLLIVN